MKRPGLLAFLGVCCLLTIWACIAHVHKRATPATSSELPTTISTNVETAVAAAQPARPSESVVQSNKTAPAQGRLKARLPVTEMTAAEKADFEQKFTANIRPAIALWCKTYAGHTALRVEDVTPDNLREISPGTGFQGYAFVIDGTTMDVCNDHGSFYVDYIMAPSAKQLMELPGNSTPPLDPAVSKQEILRLLEQDSGMDFPSDEIAIRPTSHACAMNGGVFVDVGQGVNQPFFPLTKFSMVFDPTGNLAFYGRSLRPQ